MINYLLNYVLFDRSVVSPQQHYWHFGLGNSCGALSCDCAMFTNTPGLYLLDARNIAQLWQKCLQALLIVPWHLYLTLVKGIISVTERQRTPGIEIARFKSEWEALHSIKWKDYLAIIWSICISQTIKLVNSDQNFSGTWLIRNGIYIDSVHNC